MRKLCIALFLLAACSAAGAKIFAKLVIPAGPLVMYDSSEGCQKGRNQVFLLDDAQTVLFHGCWTVVNGEIHIIWDDSDETFFPVKWLLRAEI